MEKKFDKKYSDKNTAKMIIREIKDQIKYGNIISHLLEDGIKDDFLMEQLKSL